MFASAMQGGHRQLPALNCMLLYISHFHSRVMANVVESVGAGWPDTFQPSINVVDGPRAATAEHEVW